MSAYVSTHYGIVLVKVQIVFFVFFFLTTGSYVESRAHQHSEVMKGSDFDRQPAEQMFLVLEGAGWIIPHDGERVEASNPKVLDAFDQNTVASFKSQTPHHEASRAPSCRVVMGTTYPSPFCLIAPQESVAHLWSPLARLKTKAISPKRLDNIRMDAVKSARGEQLNKLAAVNVCRSWKRG